MAKKPNTKAAPVVKTFQKTEENRKARLLRHLKKYPNDNQAKAALNMPAPVRQKPKSKNATRQYYKMVMYVQNYGHKNVPVTLSYNGGAELEYRNGMSQKEYEKEMSAKRKHMAEFMKETRCQFGSVKPNIFGESYNIESVNALCYVLGIKRSRKRK